MSSKPIPVRTERGVVVGKIVNGTFIKHVKGSKHQVRVPPGWAMDEVCLAQLQKAKAKDIRIIDDETGDEYSCSVALFAEMAHPLERWFDEQLLLVMRYWVRKGEAIHPTML